MNRRWNDSLNWGVIVVLVALFAFWVGALHMAAQLAAAVSS